MFENIMADQEVSQAIQTIVADGRDHSQKLDKVLEALNTMKIDQAVVSHRIESAEKDIQDLHAKNSVFLQVVESIGLLNTTISSQDQKLAHLGEKLDRFAMHKQAMEMDIGDLGKADVDLSKRITELTTEKDTVIKVSAWASAVIFTFILAIGGWFASRMMEDHDAIVVLREKVSDLEAYKK